MRKFTLYVKDISNDTLVVQDDDEEDGEEEDGLGEVDEQADDHEGQILRAKTRRATGRVVATNLRKNPLYIQVYWLYKCSDRSMEVYLFNFL